MPAKNKFLILIFAAAVFASGFFIWQDFQKQQTLSRPGVESGSESNPKTSDVSEAPSETPDVGLKELIQEPGGDFQGQIPNLDREIIVTESLSEETKNKVIAEIKSLSRSLKENYNYLQGWLQLGLLRKSIGDYEGTKEAWEFAALLRPNDFLAFNNLGVLFWHYLPDYPKAEENFKKALEKQPDSLMTYQNLYELYRFSYKEKSHLAEGIMLQALDLEPGNTAFMYQLADYYKEKGDKEKARLYFEKILVLEPSNQAVQSALNSL